MKPIFNRFLWLLVVGLLLPSLPAVTAAGGEATPHGFVVYSRILDVPDGAGNIRRGSCLEWESLPDHQTRRLIGPEYPQLFQSELGAATIDATGTFVAFLTSKKPAAPRQLWILRLRDGRLTHCLVKTSVLSYQWSPTGSHLAATAKTSSMTSLFLIDPATGERIKTGIQNPQTWAWSPNARFLVYVEAGWSRLSLFSLAAHRGLFRWSLAEPSDATLCFSSSRSLFVLQGKTLYQASVGRPLVRQFLVGEPVETGQVALSPHGDRLAFETAVNFTGDDPRSTLPLAVDRSIQTYAIQSQKSTVLQEWTNSETLFPTTQSLLGWSRDGRFLLITRLPDNPKADGFQLAAISLAGKSQTLFNTTALVTSLDWHEN